MFEVLTVGSTGEGLVLVPGFEVMVTDTGALVVVDDIATDGHRMIGAAFASGRWLSVRKLNSEEQQAAA
jgi:predicted RNA-binding protein with TRAM domain